jgi:hypothetical protein
LFMIRFGALVNTFLAHEQGPVHGKMGGRLSSRVMRCDEADWAGYVMTASGGSVMRVQVALRANVPQARHRRRSHPSLRCEHRR